MKLKKIAAAVLAASMLLAGCADNENRRSEREENSSRETKSSSESSSSSTSKSKDDLEIPKLTIEDGILKAVSSELTSVVIPSGVTEIEDAFGNCRKLLSVSLPDTITYISEGAFNDCTNVTVTYKGKEYSYNRLADLYEEINIGNLPKEPLDKNIILNDTDFVFYSYYYCMSCARSNKSFDITKSIDSIELFNRLLDYVFIPDDDPDKVEELEEDILGGDYYYYSLEKTEKLIQKSMFPKFKLSSVDYKKSECWSEEDNCFIWTPKIAGGGLGDYFNSFFIQEDGYKQGDYVYVTVAFVDENRGTSRNLCKTALPPASEIDIWDITPEYFDLPRYQMKFKKFEVEDHYYYEPYFLVGFKPIDERPAGFDFAKMLYSEIDSFDMYDISNVFGGFGLMDTILGKRAYIFSWSQLGSHNYMEYNNYMTYGASGENDKIEFDHFINNQIIWDTEDPNIMWGYDLDEITITDSFNGDTFKYSFEKAGHRDGTYDETAEYTHNDEPVSEQEFYSAKLVNDFKDYFKSDMYSPPCEIIKQYDYQAGSSTLADVYEIARAVIE